MVHNSMQIHLRVGYSRSGVLECHKVLSSDCSFNNNSNVGADNSISLLCVYGV